MFLEQNTSLHIILLFNSNGVIKIVHGCHEANHSNQAIDPYISNYFSLSYNLQVSICSSTVVVRDCQTHIQNIIEYTLKGNYIARNSNT